MSTPLFNTPLTLPALSSQQASALSAAAPSLCRSDLPLLLLPVRLETRFFSLAGGASELRVRVYPDKIHLDSHEPELTGDERDWGVHYWQQDWRAGGDAAARADAWRQLAERFGAERAAWIKRALTPTNNDQHPTGVALPMEQALAPEPAFPAVAVVTGVEDTTWRRPARARLLPDRWIAILRTRDGQQLQVTGGDIAKPLAVGPDPKALAETITGNQSALDGGMRWMVDFNAAETAGMGLRMTVPAALLAAGLDSLFVFGAAASLSAEETAAQLAQLLDAHHYTDGLEFLRPGTPTNNMIDRAAGVSPEAPGYENSFATEVLGAASTLDPACNAMTTGNALGLSPARIPTVLGCIDHAQDQHERDARSMNTALWHTSWGYFLSNMMGFEGTGLTRESHDWARNHFARYVRAGGAYPALRCGRQPYGILPVTSLDMWSVPAGEEPQLVRDGWLKGVLLKLRENVWRSVLGTVPRIGLRPADPDADLADVMRSDGLSNSYRTRSLFGRDYASNLRAFVGEDLFSAAYHLYAQFLNDGIQRQMGLGAVGVPARLINGALYDERTWPVSVPLVQAGETAPSRMLENNYIAQLAQAKLQDALAQPVDPALLQALLRHSLLREYAFAAALLALNVPGTTLGALLWEEELVNLITGAPPNNTWQRQLQLKIPTVTGALTVREHLDALTVFEDPAVQSLGEFRRSLAHLQSLDSEKLQYLMQGTLDLSAHRLDAWISSFAAKRLASMRAAKPEGVYVGAYGWVENLQPRPATNSFPLTVDDQGPVFYYPNDSGFIHAPSMTHAAAAALLRNAHLGSSGVPQPDSPFAINLNSRRVREATQILEGVRQGQSLSSLLGYRIERGLHEASLDRFIVTLRALAPLTPTKLPASSGPAEVVAANNVVDGLELRRLWREQRVTTTVQIQNRSLPALTADEQSRLVIELDKLDATVDAVSDALTAEAAYQIARGNTTRLASTFAAVAQGATPPAELEVAQMPRTGIALTHRLLLVMSGTTNLNTPGWFAGDAGTRSSVERLLNFWACKLLGDASKVRCTVERLDEGGMVLQTATLMLSEAGLTPLDVVYGVEAAPAGQGTSSLTAVEQLVLYCAQRKAGGIGIAANLRLQHARPGNLAAGELTLFDILEQARAIRRLLTNARGLDPEDLNPPERAGKASVDAVEFENRVVRAENVLNAAHKTLVTLLGKLGSTTNAEALRTALLKLHSLGVGGAVPVSPAGEAATSIDALAQQARAVVRISGARNDQVLALRQLAVASEPRARREQLRARMNAVFETTFVMLPRFTLDAGAAAELSSALAVSTQAQGGDPLAVNTWLARTARVRDSAARMSACLHAAEVLGTGERLNLSVAQLPLGTGERWVGLPVAAGQELPANKLSLVVQAGAALNTTQVLTGLLFDEWTEVVPSTRETTALTFQLNPPDSCAPQSVLLAVPPVPGQDWTAASLHRVLLETLDLAKLRAVSPELLGSVGNYLPGLYLAFNAKDDAPSTDFAPLTL